MVVLAFLYALGLAGHLTPGLAPLMATLTPGFLVFAGILVLVAGVQRAEVRPLVLWGSVVFVLTLAVEILGVQTGLIFGSYHYTELLGPSLGGVPLVIGWNWVLVVLGITVASRRWLGAWPWWARSIAVGLACVAFDSVLEPVAIGEGYWVWDSPGVPVQNFLAWGLIAALGSSFSEAFRPWPRGTALLAGVLMQAIFFVGLLGAKFWAS